MMMMTITSQPNCTNCIWPFGNINLKPDQFMQVLTCSLGVCTSIVVSIEDIWHNSDKHKYVLLIQIYKSAYIQNAIFDQS